MDNIKTKISTCFLAAVLVGPQSKATQLDLTTPLSRELISRTVSQSNSNQYEQKADLVHGKIGRFLVPVIERKKNAMPQALTPMVRTKNSQRVQIYLQLKNIEPSTIVELKGKSFSVEITNDELNKVQGWADISAIESLAELDSVVRITVPSYGLPAAGRVTTQGDAILRATELRALGASGQGVKVGVISDGANNWQTAANTGDLPQNVTTFGSCATRAADPQNCRPQLTCNEGTAMAEIIHDIAPDAELAVAAVSTSLEFIQQINRLANVFKADIIVDDLGFFGEPYFEDGDLARAVSALPNDILYFSSAGNSANTHYEQQYSTMGSTLHNFGVQNNINDDAIGFSIRPNRGAFVLMQWNDRYESANSNYDLFIVDQNNEVGRSTGLNSTAIEGVCVFNGSSTDAIRFALVDKISGSNRRLEMFFLGASAIEYPIPAGSVFGHAGTRKAIAVGAINAGSNSVAFYSSNGPARIDYPSFELRAKPDIAATDGVAVTGAGGFSSPFFGTSAAAPHAAAVAAQLLSASASLTPDEVRSALIGSASGGGSSAAVGRGRIDAVRAFEQLNIDLTSNGLILGALGNRNSIVVPAIMLLLDDKVP
jgi:subtilisin family serine protease